MTDPSAPEEPQSPPPGDVVPGEPPTSTPPPPSSDERLWAMLCHLSALGIFIVPAFGNVIGPLIVWMIKKDQYPLVDLHGKASLNFQLSLTLYIVGATLISIPPGFLCPPIPIMVVSGLGIVGIVFTVMAAVQANEGKFYAYPLVIPFIK